MEQEYSRWLSHVAESDLLSQLHTMSEQERREAFCCDLSFGTGGLRGIVGAGTNRMNIYTVRRATQGLANYLKAQKLPMSAAIAHDSRLYGRTFAETAACVLAANGIKVYLYPRLEPTPALSWAVRRYACGAGICITASHNPAQYNGYKVYGSDGCQITLDAANAIEAEIAVVDCFMDVQTCGYQDACAVGRIESIPDSVLDAYINAVYAQRVTDIDCSGLRLVYTPLCGSGLECVQKLLDRLGVADVTVVPSQAKPDGKFPTCPYPNPEIRESMEEGLRLCRESSRNFSSVQTRTATAAALLRAIKQGSTSLSPETKWVFCCWISSAKRASPPIPCRMILLRSRQLSQPAWRIGLRHITVSHSGGRSQASNISASRSVSLNAKDIQSVFSLALRKVTVICQVRMRAIRTG